MQAGWRWQKVQTTRAMRTYSHTNRRKTRMTELGCSSLRTAASPPLCDKIANRGTGAGSLPVSRVKCERHRYSRQFTHPRISRARRGRLSRGGHEEPPTENRECEAGCKTLLLRTERRSSSTKAFGREGPGSERSVTRVLYNTPASASNSKRIQRRYGRPLYIKEK